MLRFNFVLPLLVCPTKCIDDSVGLQMKLVAQLSSRHRSLILCRENCILIWDLKLRIYERKAFPCDHLSPKQVLSKKQNVL